MFLREKLQSLVGHVTCGAVVGYEGSLWVQTPGFFPMQREVDQLLRAFDLPEKELLRGLVFQNENFLITNNDNGTIRARNALGAIVLCKCETCMVLSFMEEHLDFEDGVRATEELAKWIREAPKEQLR